MLTKASYVISVRQPTDRKRGFLDDSLSVLPKKTDHPDSFLDSCLPTKPTR